MTEWNRDPTLPGFYRRHQATKDTWTVKARQKGTNRVVTIPIAPCNLMKVAQARLIAKGHLLKLAQGIDPNQEKQQQKDAEKKRVELDAKKSLTLKTALEIYLSRGSRKPRTNQDYQESINRNFADWLDLPLRDISGDMVIDRFEEIIERAKVRKEVRSASVKAKGKTPHTFINSTGYAEAQRSMRYLRAIFNAFLNERVDGQPILTENPTASLKVWKKTRTLRPRERCLSPKEIEMLFDEIQDRCKADRTGKTLPDAEEDYIAMLILTGARTSEILGLKWSDVNHQEGYFTFQDTKNGRRHTVPITNSLKAILLRREVEANASGSKWVFPSPLTPKEKPASMSKAFPHMKARLKISFSAHDLRRTFATTANDLGIDPLRISQALNHAKKGVTAGYIQTSLTSLRQTFEAIEMAMLQTWELPTDEANGV
jgi:integrase